ncbi:MAG TPA: flagellar hook assembly protein FlgD [Burkholderiales bacterium]|nr:flagellar hook assembly protein FlgD [Burkholderiales bacterium]
MSVSSVASSSSASSSTTPATTASGQQDRFLKLLVAQLQNQDPLNPMDNSAITTQMAQISTVSGIEQLNDTLKSLTSQQNASDQVQAATLVGHQVLVNGSTIALSGGAAAAGFSLDQDVDQLSVSILDASGNVVHTANVGAQKSGLHTFQWDGLTDSGARAPDGSYTFKVTGTAAGAAVTPQALELAAVYGVRTSDSGAPILDLGSMGTAALPDIKQIF